MITSSFRILDPGRAFHLSFRASRPELFLAASSPGLDFLSLSAKALDAQPRIVIERFNDKTDSLYSSAPPTAQVSVTATLKFCEEPPIVSRSMYARTMFSLPTIGGLRSICAAFYPNSRLTSDRRNDAR